MQELGVVELLLELSPPRGVVGHDENAGGIVFYGTINPLLKVKYREALQNISSVCIGYSQNFEMRLFVKEIVLSFCDGSFDVLYGMYEFLIFI